MHVLIAHNAYGRPSGEEHALDRLDTLLTTRGHRVSRFERSSAEIDGSIWSHAKAALAGIENPFSRRHLEQVLADTTPDVVLVQNLYPFLSPSILRACHAHDVPVVMRCSNYRLFCPSGTLQQNGTVCQRCLGPGREAWCVLKNCEGSRAKSLGYAVRHATARIGQRIHPYVDQYIVLTEFQRRYFIAQGIPAERLAIVPNHAEVRTTTGRISLPVPASQRPCSPRRSAPAPRAGREQQTADAPTASRTTGSLVTLLGRVSPEKGVADALEMARRLPHVPFAFAGAVRSNMRELLRTAPPNVRILGHLDPAALEALLDETRIVLSCSRWFEGFPNAVLEAMSAGKPVVAAAIGALPEIVDDGITGRLYAPGVVDDAVAALGALHGDAATCAAMGRAGQQKVRDQYHADHAYVAYMNAFERARRGIHPEELSEPDYASAPVAFG